MKLKHNKFISVFLIFIFILSLTGCSFSASDENINPHSGKEKNNGILDRIPNDNNAESSSSNDSGTDNLQQAINSLFSDGAKHNNNSISQGSMVRDKKYDNTNTKNVTILVYMNGSDLESEYQEATGDLSEMLAASYNPNVNIVIQTMGTKKWSSKLGITSKKTGRYLMKEDKLQMVDDSLKQLDCTRSSTLSDFIKWGAEKYPADRYILLFWDHGGGPVYGFGYDEFQSYDDSMSIDEMQLGLANGGVYFDFIGMDCCIMSCMEVCCACYDYCDYMILSEDFESGLGWSYKGWIQAISDNPAIDTVSLSKIIIDDMISANEKDSMYGDDSILALIDESYMKLVYDSWKSFAFANDDTLTGSNYSRGLKRKNGGRLLNRVMAKKDYWSDYDDPQMSDYYITDIMAAVQNIDSKESQALESALANALVYVGTTKGDANLTGLSITLPYGDKSFYNTLKSIFKNCGFDSEYINWLEKFTKVSGNSYYDYSDWSDSWIGWSDYEDDYDWNTYDNWLNDDYWCSDGSCSDSYSYDDSCSDSYCGQGWDCWNYNDYWEDDWYNYDSYDYCGEDYCSDEYLDEYREDYWDEWYDSCNPYGYYDYYGYDDWSYDDWGYDDLLSWLFDEDSDYSDSYSCYDEYGCYNGYDCYDDYYDYYYDNYSDSYGYDDYWDDGYGYDGYYDDYGYDGYYDDYGYDDYGYDDYGYDDYGYDDYGYNDYGFDSYWDDSYSYDNDSYSYDDWDW